jgi:hypothetical protein
MAEKLIENGKVRSFGQKVRSFGQERTVSVFEEGRKELRFGYSGFWESGG